jgi:hypothetical protein
MGNQQTVPVQPTAPQADLRWRYDKALELLQSHDQIFWLKNTAFILAHTIILGGIGNIVASSQDAQLRSRWIFGLAILGFLVGVLWLTVFEYNYTFYKLRMAQVRLLEEGNPGRLTNLLTMGRILHNEAEVELSENNARESVKASWAGRMFWWLHGAGPVRVMIGLFLLAYVALLCYPLGKTLCRLLCG